MPELTDIELDEILLGGHPDDSPDIGLEYVHLTDDFAEMTVKVALGKIPVPQPTFPEPVRLELGGQEFRDFASASLELKDGTIQFTMSLPTFPPLQLGGGRRATIYLDDGSRVEVPDLFLFRRQGATYHFEGFTWEWTRATRARYLISALPDIRVPHQNLRVSSRNHSSGGHFRGHGNYRWHILKAETKKIALVDGGQVNTGLLGIDIRAMRFVCGTDLSLQVFWKLDASGAPCGAIGLGTAPSSESRSRPPAGHDTRSGIAWSAALFASVVEALRNGVKAVIVATSGYSDTLTGHLDGCLALGNTALEAACKSMPEAAPPKLLAEKEKWLAWIDSHKDEIAALAIDEDASQELLGKLKAAHILTPSSTSLLPKTLAGRGIALNALTRKTLRNSRNKCLHGYFRWEPHGESFQELLTELELIQTLLATLVALSVGYRGPLAGWERTESHRPRDPDFWPIETPPEARRFYECGIGPLTPRSH